MPPWRREKYEICIFSQKHLLVQTNLLLNSGQCSSLVAHWQLVPGDQAWWWRKFSSLFFESRINELKRTQLFDSVSLLD